MIINHRELARAEVIKLKNGFSAYSENTLVTELIEKYIKEQGFHVHIDKTPMGCWFIPIIV
ncbi:hypothetical protein [Ammoniphilus sp. 3BR4]|uniref:hypothetical protein n=1 Tax=Ammoniphilus sp. 3BR4 TaxID=3158265 RepID=UPI0034654C9B